MTITPANWPWVSRQIAWPADPDDFDENAVKRALKLLGNRFIKMPKIPSKFKSYNNVKIMDFDSETDRIYYASALARYEEEVQRIIANGEPRIRALVEDGKLRQASEKLKTRHIANRAYCEVQEGYSAVVGFCFKESVVDCVNVLVHDRKVDPAQIAIVWGGYNLDERRRKEAENILKQKFTPAQLQEYIQDGLFDNLLDVYTERKGQDLGAIDSKLLGQVDQFTRWQQICRFQNGRARYCIFTAASGGVALSLHDENEEASFPRRSHLGLPYGEKMVVQLYGRAHRVTSVSDTYQSSYAFNGTRDIKVAKRVSQKLRSARHTGVGNYNKLLWTSDELDVDNQYIEHVNPEEYVTEEIHDEE